MPRQILEIRVGPAADALDRFEAAWNRLAEGRPVRTLSVLTLPTLPQLVQTLSPARWALLEATMHALRHPVYSERYQRTKQRLGRQRGPKVAQIDLSRKLTEAIWHMLTRNQPFAPAGATFRLAA